MHACVNLGPKCHSKTSKWDSVSQFYSCLGLQRDVLAIIGDEFLNYVQNLKSTILGKFDSILSNFSQKETILTRLPCPFKPTGLETLADSITHFHFWDYNHHLFYNGRYNSTLCDGLYFTGAIFIVEAAMFRGIVPENMPQSMPFNL